MSDRTEHAAKTRRARFVVDAAMGDGRALAPVPPPLRQPLRSLGTSVGRMRRARLMHTAARLYPILARIEEKLYPAAQRLLVPLPLDQALEHPQVVERALQLFDGAWKAGLLAVRGRDGKPIPAGDRKRRAAACGMTVGEAEQIFLDRVVTAVFRDNPIMGEKLQGAVGTVDGLGKVRALAGLDALTVEEFTKGLGQNFLQMLARLPAEQLEAVVKLKPYHIRPLRTILKNDFRKVLDWEPGFLTAIAESFHCVEQIRDLDEDIDLISDPDSIRVLGSWTTIDITEKVNEERRARGQARLKGRRFETDIGALRRILGGAFADLVQRPPALLAAFGQIMDDLRTLPPQQRGDRIEQLRVFAERYVEYMTPQVLVALKIIGPNNTRLESRDKTDPTFGEALNMLEGLWLKDWLGRKFFEGPLQEPQGASAIALLVKQFAEMKARGSIKGEAEVVQIVAHSDLLDGPLRPFMKLR
ncbi:hypothetical protein [Caenispirillum bisanense]|uniref:hypothetical protein n=1 Tax=Caenispirillum bisanense TaxID=414052 RepID=UPI0031E3B133